MRVQARDRLVALSLIAVSVALLITRLLLLQGWSTVVQIDGGSMAETLLGEHVSITCGSCSRQWAVDTVQWQAQPPMACPDCGRWVDEHMQVVELPARRVIIDQTAYLVEAPQRFDIVAFHSSELPGELAVKRIVALPGEEWEVCHGDLYVDEQLIRKNYSQFRELATLVSNSATAWRAPDDSAWRYDNGMWNWRSISNSPQWLEYDHLPSPPAARTHPSAIQDSDPYNPALSRDLNDVSDVAAVCRIDAHDIRLECRVHDGFNTLNLDCDLAAGLLIARRDDRELARCDIPRGNITAGQLLWGVWDRQLFLVRNQQVLLRHPLPETSKVAEPSSTPLAIRVSGVGACRIGELQVFRDIYYLNSHGRDGSWKSPKLADQSYGMLGDNPPLSIDSRQWEHGIDRSAIVGRVFPRP